MSSPVDVVKNVLFKEDNGVDSRFSKMSVNRYLSWYDPILCEFVNGVVNDERLNHIDGDFYLKFLRNVLPKLPKKFIQMERQQPSEEISKEAKNVAEIEEISPKEVDLYLKEFNLNIEKYG